METNSFVESLNLILQESRDYSVMIENTFHIHEVSLSDYIRKIDFKKIFKFILEKFIEIIKAIWDRFRAAYHSFTSKAVLLKRYKKKLENISWEVKIDEYPSIYSNLDSSTNISMYKMSLNEEYSILTGELERISGCRDLDDIHNTILSIKNSMDNINDFLDQERGIALGSRSGISKEDFPKEVINYFKSEKQSLSNILQPDEIKRYTKEYFESKSLEKSITKDQSLLESSAKNMINKINSLNIFNYIPNKEINVEIGSMFGDIIKESCNRVQGLCNIYIELFSIKLDVFKIYKEEQVRILSKVILKSIKEGKM